jgi:hypothetical protein
MNPVYLYLVITNNSSVADLQQSVWLLPHRVRSLTGIKLVGTTLRIETKVDSDPNDSSKSVPRELIVRYNVSDRMLANTILVTQR